MGEVKKPVFSIVMPTYNHGHLIGKAISSVLMQSWQDWELLVVDNQSADNTKAIVLGFEDQRIKYFSIQNHGIIAASRKLGIDNANGDWIAFLDSDDWWTTDKLDVCREHISNYVDVMYHELTIVQGNSESKIIRGRQTQYPVLKDLLVRGNPLATSSVVARRNLLTKVAGKILSPEYKAAADFACWLRLAELTNNFLCIPKLLGFYLIHEQSVSRRDMSDPSARACEPFLHVLNSKELKLHRAWIGYTKGRFLYLNGLFRDAIDPLRFALRADSLTTRLKAAWMLLNIYLLK
jgi:glycosyltransferase involved in cell wall biosynthesis